MKKGLFAKFDLMQLDSVIVANFKPKCLSCSFHKKAAVAVMVTHWASWPPSVCYILGIFGKYGHT